jgi:hypothetical protein
MAAPLDALRSMRDELWDGDRGMDRYAPGVVPGVDISALDLHAVRETALGAFLDLGDGHHDRAIAALRSVLALQYPDSSWPWSGTFPVAAETPDPPGADAVEWVHYDPNWRQFVGCTLAMCRLVHGHLLPGDVHAAIGVALDGCVTGEPADRIARWYTNPNLMHAWLQGHVGTTHGDDGLVAAGHARLAMLLERFERHGDIDEYNSPTYDGIDLWAIGLWAVHPPTPRFAEAAATMLPRVGARISTLYHPTFGATCGPYIRAYGLDPTRYVSLSGLLFSVVGEPSDRVLPTAIGADTVHVHDLYFLPVLDHVAASLAPHLHLSPVDGERRHDQRFTGSVASSLLRPDLAVGWEHGRRHDASLDQYVPFSAHLVEAAQGLRALGLMVPPETAWVDVERVGDLEFVARAAGRDSSVGLRVVGNEALTAHGSSLTTGRLSLTTDRPPGSSRRSVTAAGHQVHLTWPAERIEAHITIADRR